MAELQFAECSRASASESATPRSPSVDRIRAGVLMILCFDDEVGSPRPRLASVARAADLAPSLPDAS